MARTSVFAANTGLRAIGPRSCFGSHDVSGASARSTAKPELTAAGAPPLRAPASGCIRSRRLRLGAGLVVNAIRSTPFVVLLVLLLPFTQKVVGTTIGPGRDSICWIDA